MSQNQHFDPRIQHSKPDADKTQPPRPPKYDTEARLRAHVHGHGATHSQTAAQNPYSGSAAAVSHTRPPSNLSVNAPEFKPKVYQYQGGSSSIPQLPPALSVGAAEFVPRTDFVPVRMGGPPRGAPPLQVDDSCVMSVPPPPFLPPQGPGGVAAPLLNSLMNKMNLNAAAGPGGAEPPREQTDLLLDEFSRTMFILTTHPANVREFLQPLCDKLQVAQSQALLMDVINILYEQSIYIPNFRYTGARVVHFLSHELKNHTIFGQFKAQFLTRCQMDYKDREMMVRTGEDGLTRLCGLTMFMGELFLNVSADAHGKTERLTFLPSVLTDLLLTLLSQPSETSVKTVCQLLKLAGGPTEDSVAQSVPDMQNFNRIFTTLQDPQFSERLSATCTLLVKSVLTLRQTNWGRVDPRLSNSADSAQDNMHAPPKDFSQQDPVFYTTDGKPISREEAGYQEEEDEEDYEDYELTEEEEQDFLIWQEESSGHRDPMGMGPPGLMTNANGRPPYPEGAMYQQWSTAEADYGMSNFSQGYDYNTYQYIEDDGLTDEMEKAYEEFLSSQRGPPSARQ
ncbi:hypothetical protein ACOMHN_032591 [Nucella lapillus]